VDGSRIRAGDRAWHSVRASAVQVLLLEAGRTPRSRATFSAERAWERLDGELGWIRQERCETTWQAERLVFAGWLVACAVGDNPQLATPLGPWQLALDQVEPRMEYLPLTDHPGGGPPAPTLWAEAKLRLRRRRVLQGAAQGQHWWDDLWGTIGNRVMHHVLKRIGGWTAARLGLSVPLDRIEPENCAVYGSISTWPTRPALEALLRLVEQHPREAIRARAADRVAVLAPTLEPHEAWGCWEAVWRLSTEEGRHVSQWDRRRLVILATCLDGDLRNRAWRVVSEAARSTEVEAWRRRLVLLMVELVEHLRPDALEDVRTALHEGGPGERELGLRGVTLYPDGSVLIDSRLVDPALPLASIDELLNGAEASEEYLAAQYRLAGC
jgi:hypothetical protein